MQGVSMTSRQDDYIPSQKILKNYAHVLINYALNSGEGIKKGEIVQCVVPDIAKPLALLLQNTILESGGHPIMKLIPTGFNKDFYTLANDDQLSFFPVKLLKERVSLIDHHVSIIADPDPMELSSVDPKKIIKSRDSKKAYRDWIVAKENDGNFTWTIGLWAVESKAKIVGLSLEEYWQQIISACFLDMKDPVAEWRKITKMQDSIKDRLNSLSIDYLKVKGEDVDIKISIGEKRLWKGGEGRNIPSFEIFTSPDWRGINGWIRFNQPLYRYGNIIEDIRLELKDGLVVKAEAKKGNEFLQEMLKSPNANKIGEYSLTDNRMSKISHPMAETLFDENMGGPFGNTHLAIGSAYRDCYTGDPSKVTDEEWEELGYNNSAEHTDMVSTTDRTVTAILADGAEKVIYTNGQFVI